MDGARFTRTARVWYGVRVVCMGCDHYEDVRPGHSWLVKQVRTILFHGNCVVEYSDGREVFTP